MGNVEKLAKAIGDAVYYTKNFSGKAQYAAWHGGNVTVKEGTIPAVPAVPVNLYEGKMVWVQLTEGNRLAVIIGD